MRKRLMWLGLYLVILALNVLPVALFWEKAQFTSFSILPTVLMGYMLLKAATCYVFRHKGDYLHFSGMPSFFMLAFFAEDKDYTYEEAYTKHFFGGLYLYLAAIPFQLPFIFFVGDDPLLTMLSLLVIAAPNGVFFCEELRETWQEARERKEARARQEKELLGQQRREEEGKWR